MTSPLAGLRYALELDAAAILPAVGLDEDPWQAGILRALFPPGVLRASFEAERPPVREHALQVAVVGARQGAGKSTTFGAAGVVQLMVPGSHTYIAGPSEDQSKEVLAKAAAMLRDGGLVGPLVDPREVQATLIRSRVGSWIRALSSNERTGRGKTAHLMIVTEGAFASDGLIDGLTPSLGTTNGPLVLESSAFAQMGRFFEAFDVDGEGFPKHTGGPHPGRLADWTTFARPVEMCTRLSPEFVAMQRRKGPIYFDPEFRCRFMPTTLGYFSPDVIRAAQESGIRPSYPDSEWVLPVRAEAGGADPYAIQQRPWLYGGM